MSKGYVGVDGVAREIKKMYYGDSLGHAVEIHAIYKGTENGNAKLNLQTVGTLKDFKRIFNVDSDNKAVSVRADAPDDITIYSYYRINGELISFVDSYGALALSKKHFNSITYTGDYIDQNGFGGADIIILDCKSIPIRTYGNRGYMDFGFSEAKIIDLSRLDFSDAKYVGFNFAYNSDLEHIYVNSTWDINKTDGERNYMFGGCPKLHNYDGTTNETKCYVGEGGYFELKG